MSRETLPHPTRRAVLRATAGALGVGVASTAGGHPADGEHQIHEHHDAENAERVGYHNLVSDGEPEVHENDHGHEAVDDAMHGVVSEVWVEGDYAYVSFLSSSEPHGNRGVAILDVREYTRADTVDEMHDAEMRIVSFIGNETEAGTAADVKVSEDGQYLAYSKQAIGTLYGSPASASVDVLDAPGAMPLGVEVYDISDKSNPRYLGTGQGPNVGFHNCFVHEIDGVHYVFGVQGAVPGDRGIHVFRVNPEGGVVPVNFWSGGDLAQGEYGENGVDYYCHDFYAHDDPETGLPLGYVSYWNYGLQVIDLSDPTDIEELGVGKLPRTHYAQPAPVLLDDGDGGAKRVFVGSQEHGEQVQDVSGYVRIFDGDPIFDDSGDPVESAVELPELDTWTLYENVNYDGYSFSPHNSDVTEDGWITQAHYHAGVRFLKIQNPAESPGNEGWHIAGTRYETTEPRKVVELDDGESFSGFVEAGALDLVDSTHEFVPDEDAYDAIEATLEWGPANEAQDLNFYLQKDVSDDGEDPVWLTVGESATRDHPESFEAPVETGTRYRFVVAAYVNAFSSYEITSTYYEFKGRDPERREKPGYESDTQAYYRDHVEVPPESQTEGPMAPNFWSAREENGVTFAGDINTGLYAIVADPVPVGTRTVDDSDD